MSNMERMKYCFAVAALIATALFAQVASGPDSSQATVFAGQKIGETFDEWMAANQFNLSYICGRDHKGDKRMNFKASCKLFTAFRAGQSGSFETVDTKQRRITWQFAGASVISASMSEIVSIPSSPSLVNSSAEEQIKFLSEIYGPPSHTQSIQHSNLEGGTWTTLQALWAMPDGAEIDAVEELVPEGVFGPTRFFRIKALSREYAAQIKRQNDSKPNPYSN